MRTLIEALSLFNSKSLLNRIQQGLECVSRIVAYEQQRLELYFEGCAQIDMKGTPLNNDLSVLKYPPFISLRELE